MALLSLIAARLETSPSSEHTHLGFLAVIGEVVQTVGAVGREVFHLQGWAVPGLVLGGERLLLRKAGSGTRESVCSRVSTCVHACSLCVSKCVCTCP